MLLSEFIYINRSTGYDLKNLWTAFDENLEYFDAHLVQKEKYENSGWQKYHEKN